MPRRKKILVVNDDGITAPGIRTLVEAMKELGDVLVVAPDKPQSGMGHAITVNDPLRMHPVNDYHDVEAYSCSGTPVDCVKLAIYKVLKGHRPDLCVSGINHGANNSINVLYSGTMSAAVEGAIENIPSIGFSLLNHDYNADFDLARIVAGRIAGQVLKRGLPQGVCLNVNIPNISEADFRGIKICRQGQALWEDRFDVRKDPFGNEYYWLTGEFKNCDGGQDTDIWALENNYASVVPTQFDMTAHHDIAHLNTWRL